MLEEIHPQFDRIIWKSLSCQRPLAEFLDRNIISAFTRILELPLDLESRIASVMELLSAQRCLIVLDDLHKILWEGELAGNYALGYREYQQLFQRIRETPHQSCLILLSWEKLREIQSLGRRGLITKTMIDRTMVFGVQSIVAQFCNILPDR